jgi:hypothetical protein
MCKHSSAHRRFTEWAEAGVFEKLWQKGLVKYNALKGIDWRWLSMDGAMTKSPLGGEKKRQKPYRQGKTGNQKEPSHRRRRYSSVYPGGWRQQA